MGMTPSETEEYTHAQFVVKAKGFQNSKDRSEVILRRATGFLMSVQLDKKSKFDIEKSWPILSDKQKKEYRSESVFSKEKIKTMMDLLAKEGK